MHLKAAPRRFITKNTSSLSTEIFSPITLTREHHKEFSRYDFPGIIFSINFPDRLPGECKRTHSQIWGNVYRFDWLAREKFKRFSLGDPIPIYFEQVALNLLGIVEVRYVCVLQHATLRWTVKYVTVNLLRWIYINLLMVWIWGKNVFWLIFEYGRILRRRKQIFCPKYVSCFCKSQ